jgi:hypothetical protein
MESPATSSTQGAGEVRVMCSPLALLQGTASKFKHSAHSLNRKRRRLCYDQGKLCVLRNVEKVIALWTVGRLRVLHDANLQRSWSSVGDRGCLS